MEVMRMPARRRHIQTHGGVGWLETQLVRLRQEAERQGLVCMRAGKMVVHAEEMARRSTVRMHPTSFMRTLNGTHPPTYDSLLAISTALGVVWPQEKDLEPYPVAGDANIPIIGEVAAATGELDIACYDLGAVGSVETVSDAGRVGVRLHGDSARPVFLDGQIAICDTNTDPDDAPPHRDVNAPIAVGIITAGPYEGMAFIKRWYHQKATGLVTLRSINPEDVDDTGELRKLEVSRRQIDPAWAVCGQRWW